MHSALRSKRSMLARTHHQGCIMPTKRVSAKTNKIASQVSDFLIIFEFNAYNDK